MQPGTVGDGPAELARLTISEAELRRWLQQTRCRQQAGTDTSLTQGCVCRVELVQLLISEAKRMFPSQISFHFNSPCEGWNLAAKEVHLATPYGDSTKAGTSPGMHS